MFLIAKVFWMLASPGALLLWAVCVGALLLWLWPRTGRRLLTLLAVGLLLLVCLPVDSWLLRPLEERFPRPELPRQVAGIIVLGGYQNPMILAGRGVPELNGHADRLLAFVDLARQHPEARLVATGGSGSLFHPEYREAAVTRLALEQLGFGVDRVLFEGESRDTAENASRSFALLHPGPDEQWVLVTSAFHMPRSVAVFRAAGWSVIPYPVDYQTLPAHMPGNGYAPGDLESRLHKLSLAFHEWVGLVSYYMMGRSRELFPAP